MKYYGMIGFAETQETSVDVWDETLTEYPYYGDVQEGYGRSASVGTEINPQLSVNNKISIVADPYLMKHYFNMKYIVWEGVKWNVANVTLAYPRLIVSLGGLYHDQSS